MNVISLVASIGFLLLVAKLATSSTPLSSGSEWLVFLMVLCSFVLFTLTFLFTGIAIFFGVTDVYLTATSIEVKRSGRTDVVALKEIRNITTSVVQRMMRYRKTAPLYLIDLETDQEKHVRFGVMGPIGKEMFDRFNALKNHV